MTPFIWALLTAATWGVVPLLEKLGLARIDPMVGLFYRSSGVVIGIVLLMLWKAQSIKTSLAQPPQGWELLVLGGFLASVVGQIFFYHALKSGEISRVVLIAGAYPLVSFLLGTIFLGEKITLAKSCGLASVLIGIFLLK